MHRKSISLLQHVWSPRKQPCLRRGNSYCTTRLVGLQSHLSRSTTKKSLGSEVTKGLKRHTGRGGGKQLTPLSFSTLSHTGLKRDREAGHGNGMIYLRQVAPLGVSSVPGGSPGLCTLPVLPCLFTRTRVGQSTRGQHVMRVRRCAVQLVSRHPS